MDNDGAFKKSARRGHYTPEQAMAAATANELMSIRYSRLGGEEPVFFQSDAQLAEAGEAEYDADSIEDMLTGGEFEAMFWGQVEDREDGVQWLDYSQD